MPDERVSRDFLDLLDTRLLDLTTGVGVLSVEEYEQWRASYRLTHIQHVRVVKDAIAATMQDVYRALGHLEAFLGAVPCCA